jgi:integrase/recombinase XerD
VTLAAGHRSGRNVVFGKSSGRDPSPSATESGHPVLNGSPGFSSLPLVGTSPSTTLRAGAATLTCDDTRTCNSTLIVQRNRRAWRLLAVYAAGQTGKAPSILDIGDLDAALIAGFPGHLETVRHNTVRSRNARLAAIHSLFAYAAPEHPEHAGDIARVLAIPAKKFDSTLVTHLTEPEITALLAAPDPGTWTGRRDHALLLAAVTTGLRASPLTGLTRSDVHLGVAPHVACHGKGRKDRITPLTGDTVAVLAAWMTERDGVPGDPLFCTRRGTALSLDAIEARVRQHAAKAALTCPSLAAKTTTPHVLRHSCVISPAVAARDTVKSRIGRVVSHKYAPFREPRTAGPGPRSFLFAALFFPTCLTWLTR